MDDRPSSVKCACGRAVDVPPSPAAAKDLRCPACGKPVSAAPRKEGSTVRRTTTSSPELPPNSIPGYVFQKRIGQGGMGEVFLAKQVSLDRLVAVKLLPPELAQDRAYVENFVKEARSAGKLNHENITGAVDVGDAGGRYYFVMEYVAGDTLWNVVRKQGPLPEAKALDVVRQVARGLRHAHQNGFVHRDIKPKNLLLTAEGVVKICDFGLARALKEDADAGEEGVLHVTPAYASPEQCKADPSLDHRTDIYSLGVTLFETLTGKRPFTGATSKEIMRKHLSEEPASPATLVPSISPGTCALVARMLRKKPDERFKTYDELLAAIETIGALSPALRVSTSSPAPSPKKKIALAGAVAVAAAVVVAILLLFTGKPKVTAPVVDPQVDAALREARALQAAADGKPADYAAVKARWQELEARFRGGPDHPAFFTGLREFESKMGLEADRIAAELLADADGSLRQGKPLEALRSLRRYPPAFGKLEAGIRVGTKAFEAERALEGKVATDLKSCEELSSAGRFDDARSKLHLLRLAVSETGDDGKEAILPAFAGRIEDVRKRIDADQATALKRAKETEPGPVIAKPAVPTPPPPVPEPAVKTPDVSPPTPKPKPSATVPQMVFLRDPSQRGDPLKRAEAVKIFRARASRHPFSKAAALFLERPEAEWKLDGPAGPALAEYLASPSLDAPSSATPEQHAALFALLAQKIAAAGGKAVDVLQLFACAHAAEIASRKERVDPGVALQARFGKGAVSDLWGPSATVGRIEAAGLLAKPPGPWIVKAGEAALAAPDLETRVLGILFTLKEPMIDAALAADKWKKFGAASGDPAWQKTCDGVAERIRAPIPCESCSGQGKYPCGACGAAGITACSACRGVGAVVDPSEGGKVTCAACKGRKAALCGVCNGAKSHKCAACDTRKSRPLLPAAYFRMILDLAACDTCAGLGTALPGAAWPCASCAGYGRRVSELPAEFAKLPPWTKSREGRTAWNALRWISRHQTPAGFWSAADPGASCREPGCLPSPGGAFDLGATALTLMAFSGAGFDPLSDVEVGGTPAGETMRRALAWILARQDVEGLIASGQSTIKPVFEHLAALLALGTVLQTVPVSGAYPERDRMALRDAMVRGVRWALATQAKGGGWGYTATAPSDSWVTSWGAHALLAAREAGLEIPKMNLGWILQWYDATTDKTDFHIGYSPALMGRVNLPGNEAFLHHDTLSAYGGLVRMAIDGRAQTSILAAEKNVERDLPSGDPLRRDYAYWYLGTAFLAQRDQRKGTPWERWSQALSREILALQETADTCALGSMPAVDRWSAHGGKIYAAAAAALSLEVAAGIRPPALPGKK